MSKHTRVYVIPAEVHSDDRVYEADFDAVSWFKQANDEEIIGLAAIRWGGNYESDAVAEFVAENEVEVSDVFKYIRRKGEGFECHVSGSYAVAWIRENRPSIVDAVIAAEA